MSIVMFRISIYEWTEVYDSYIKKYEKFEELRFSVKLQQINLKKIKLISTLEINQKCDIENITAAALQQLYFCCRYN